MWLLLFLLFILPTSVLADHATPERVVEGKYTIIVSPNHAKGEIRFFFRNSATGKNITESIKYQFSIEGIDSGGVYETQNGIGVVPYIFSRGGLHELNLTFVLLGKKYIPEHWTLWVPGEASSFFERYPVGYTEIAGFVTLLVALIILIVTAIINKRREPYTIDVLKFFGL